MWSLTWKQLSNFITVSKSLLWDRKKSQLSPQHGKKYALFYPETSTVGKEGGKKKLSKKKKNLNCGLYQGRRKQWHIPSSQYLQFHYFMQPKCWAKRCPGDVLFWKTNTKQICWDLSLSRCSGIPEEKMNSYKRQPFDRTFPTLLALLRCCNSSSWSWTGESVHLDLGRTSLKWLRVPPG